MQQSGEHAEEAHQQSWEAQDPERTAKLTTRITTRAQQLHKMQQMQEAKSSTLGKVSGQEQETAEGQLDPEYQLAHLACIDEMSSTQSVDGHTQVTSKTWRPAMLAGANLCQRDLSSRYLAHADLHDAKLVGVNFSRANLSAACLSGADLSQADLTGADLSGATLTGANFRDANLQNAVLTGANLLGACNLLTEQIVTTIRDNTTQLDIEVDVTLRLPSVRRSTRALSAEVAHLETPWAFMPQGAPGTPDTAPAKSQEAPDSIATPLLSGLTGMSVQAQRNGMSSPTQNGKSLPVQKAVKFSAVKPLPAKAVKRKQPAATNRSSVAIPALLTPHKQNDLLLFIVIFVIVLSLTPLLVVAGVKVGFSLVLVGIGALLLAAIVVRWPASGFYVIVGCVLLIEQNPLQYPDGTDRLYIFYWPPNMAGFIERPIGIVMLFVLLALVLHHLAKRQRLLSGGALFFPFLCFLLCVAFGVVHGLISGGNFKIIVLEIRPLWYLFLSYLLGYNLVTHKKQIRNFLWAIIIGAGVKGIQGTYIVLVYLHGHLQGQNEIMAHEESFFFVALILLVILFSLHYNYRPQFFAALLVMPCLLVALIANNRRADYSALLIGIMVSWALAILVKPQARKGLVIALIIFVALGAAYVVAFAHAGGSFGEPARALMSVIQPSHADARDIASNLYRIIENYDLKYTVRLNPLGLGFGKPFLQPILLPNIVTLDPYYNYVPHNTIYWIWMRLGPIGYFALWYLFGAIIIRGCLIARQLRDRYLQLVAIYIVAIVFMEVVVAFADYQLFFYRNVIYLGLLTGLLLKLPTIDQKIDEKKEQPVHESAHSDRQLAASGMGGQRT